MADYVNNSTTISTSTVDANTAAAAGPLIAVIVILSVLVAAAIFFLKAEAHLRCDRETTMDGLLVEPMSRLTGES